MPLTISQKLSRDKTKIWYYLETGKGKGERWATKIYTFAKPSGLVEKEFNKQQLRALETKRAEILLNGKDIKKKEFLPFYSSFVIENSRPTSRHLQGSLNHFKTWIEKEGITGEGLTEEGCIKFRTWLMKKFSGRTPKDYFTEFKRVCKYAQKEGVFTVSPCADVQAKSNPMKVREILLDKEFLTLMEHPCPHPEVYRAVITALWTGLAFVDISKLKYSNIKDGVISIVRSKGQGQGYGSVRVPVHEILNNVILTGEPDDLVFNLPTHDGTNKILKAWVKSAGIQKHITFHALRHSFSVHLLRMGVKNIIVAGLMGHKTTRQVDSTYQQFVAKDGADAILKLPS